MMPRRRSGVRWMLRPSVVFFAEGAIVMIPLRTMLLIAAFLGEETRIDGSSFADEEMMHVVVSGASSSSLSSSSSSSSSSLDYDFDIHPTNHVVMETVTVARGTRAVLRCKVQTLGVKTVIWRKEGEGNPLAIGLFPFAADARITSDFNVRTGQWVLMIDNVRSEDEGTYFCQVSSKATHVDSIQRTRLNVKSVSIDGMEYVEWGTSVQFVCSATGRPDPPRTLDWYRDGKRLWSDAAKGVLITKNVEQTMTVSVLTLESVKMADAAEYICQASNHEHAAIAVKVVRTTPAANRVSSINCSKSSVVCSSRTRTMLSVAMATAVVTMVVRGRAEADSGDREYG